MDQAQFGRVAALFGEFHVVLAEPLVARMRTAPRRVTLTMSATRVRMEHTTPLPSSLSVGDPRQAAT